MILIKYGIINNNIDVTTIVFTTMIKNNIIYIPYGDINRSKYFDDPLPNVLKSIFIIIDDVLTEYTDKTPIYIDTINNLVYTDKIPGNIRITYPIPSDKLYNIHKDLKIDYGSFKDELPEQLMAVKYLNGNEKVLEIGGNIGRNSLVIAYILNNNNNNNNNFVSLECDTNIYNQLCHNKDLNNLNFFIENSALSNRKLIQKGWDTIVSNELLDGYTEVNTITLNELYHKYNINFDTLVLDCEGAFYYILLDMPYILDNIKLIIMENDYLNIEHKNYIDNVLHDNDYYIDHSESGGWGPCYNNFFEVWKKNI